MKEVKFLNKNTRLTNYSTIPDELYGEGISSTAMVVFAKLLNRANLSVSNGRVDEYGRVYVIYRISNLARRLDELYQLSKKRSMNLWRLVSLKRDEQI